MSLCELRGKQLLVYDEQISPLDDSYDGDKVAILAAVGRRIDKHFALNYAWAKHAADTGKLKEIAVVVLVDGTNWVHTVAAVRAALAAARLHPAASFRVHVEPGGASTTASKVLEVLGAELSALVEPVADKTSARGRRSQGKDDDKGE
ncbi:Uncharacterised protein [Mycobacteroides abscessus subsp. abscessus]|uniref:hypothetical protein n=1 Tax=Mycobacteroides abscessus TaxID=36809 RepID=UPI000928429D|nr:hypothetical protein [Mycobacteroides abscessus]SIL71447.1 Uncharacterised protein [Mycobacteroides abscessus subsp. abscessus]